MTGLNPFGVQFSPEEEEEFNAMARSEGFYERFAKNVAPSTFGSLGTFCLSTLYMPGSCPKKAISCLLFGGSKKVWLDGMRLTGDINVLLLGDPGMAKSQLLKFVEKVTPIAVYTSGKGSSAAGLTASVQRDSISHEFCLEGSAMVLADTGVVCIDEFDKMRDEDRVAIHEAMEQQTISIAKAGITTVLNSTSFTIKIISKRDNIVIWNSIFYGGERHETTKTLTESLTSPGLRPSSYLSQNGLAAARTLVLRDEQRDRTIAKHVMNIHMNRPNSNAGENGEVVGEIDIDSPARAFMGLFPMVARICMCLFGDERDEPLWPIL